MNGEKAGMRTIAFYSYKGGVGRSLTVANVAMYLARLGKNVFVVDMDLEAPGLHYKFKRREPTIRQGMVDILYDFQTSGYPPESLEPYVIDVSPEGESVGKVHLLPAGAGPTPAYWKKLAKLDWYKMFYIEEPEEPEGVPMFLELRAFIEEDYKPDFLLLDARTGITEMGGVAITVLADQVVFLMLSTQEHLEGSRAVMRSLQKLTRIEAELHKINLVAVLSRMPSRKDDDDSKELERVRTFLNETPDDLIATLEIDEVFPLHREPALEEREFVLVGSEVDFDDSPLLADYIRLFRRFVSPAEFETSQRMIADLFDKAAEDPDNAEEAMEELSRRFVHPDASRALIRMYRLRRSSPAKILMEARKLWKMTKEPADPLLWDVVRKYDQTKAFGPLPPGSKALAPEHYIDFIENVWSAHGGNDSEVAAKLVALCERMEAAPRAERILERLLASTEAPSPAMVVKLLELLQTRGAFERAHQIIGRFMPTLHSVDSFVEAWANVLLMEADYHRLHAAVHDPEFPWPRLSKRNIALAGRLCLFQDDKDTARGWFEDLMNAPTWVKWGKRVLVPGGAFARDLGRSKEFLARLKKVFSQLSYDAMVEAIDAVPPLPDAPEEGLTLDEALEETDSDIPTL